MPSAFTVFLVIDAMLAKGEQPSLGKVHVTIPAGGSRSDVCKHLRAWRKTRSYNPKLEPTDMSKASKEAGQAFDMDV